MNIGIVIFLLLGIVIGFLTGWVTFARMVNPKLKRLHPDWRSKVWNFMVTEFGLSLAYSEENDLFNCIVDDDIEDI